MNRIRPNVLLIVLFAALAAFSAGCASEKSKEPTLTAGNAAPDFSAEAIGGGEVKLADYRGKPLVLAFMAEWCPCSNESAPVFKEAHSAYSPRVEFLMLGFQDSRSKFEKFVDRERFPFRAGFDKGDSIGASYGVNAPPTTFFITPDGTIERVYYGKISEGDKLRSWIDELLEKSVQKGAGVQS